jgi:ATP-dependent DNA helicase DinG
LTTPVERVRHTLSVHGPLAASPGFACREAQVTMAVAVAEAIDGANLLAVEAGTGVGKTLAYLVPLLHSGRRALLSTATQALQEQLFGRDIPALTQTMGIPVRVAMLKGRSSYLCVHRLAQASELPSRGNDPALASRLEQVRQWAGRTQRGDLAELPWLDERSPLRPWITSTRDNCLRDTCPRRDGCHVNLARQEALQADWVVINHHLFFSSHPDRGAWLAGLVERAEVVVFDEAHRLNSTCAELTAQSVSSGSLRALARDVVNLAPRWASGQRAWAHLALVLEQTALMPPPCPPGRHRWLGAQRVERWSAWIMAVRRALQAVVSALQATAGAAAEMDGLYRQAHDLWAGWERLSRSDGNGDVTTVTWLDVGSGGWALVQASVDASRHIAGALALAEGQSWVFTSATLGTDDALGWFTEPLGLRHHPLMRTLRVPSPFDHTRQLALHVPDDLPDPADARHTPLLAQGVARWAARLGGRTLVLTTTLRATARLSEALQHMVGDGTREPLQLLCEGQMSRRELLARFRAAARGKELGAVLVASMAFWEGVDLAGEVLQLLVIDKLPFPPPDDPLVEARARQHEAQGRSAFRSCYLPQAALALKQGAGRLIRSETDRGVLVVADRRLLTRSYGNDLLEAMPPMRRLLDERELLKELDQLALTRTSTKGC